MKIEEIKVKKKKQSLDVSEKLLIKLRLNYFKYALILEKDYLITDKETKRLINFLIII